MGIQLDYSTLDCLYAYRDTDLHVCTCNLHIYYHCHLYMCPLVELCVGLKLPSLKCAYDVSLRYSVSIF